MKYKKEILSNMMSLGAVDALGLIIPIVTMPILSRALGADAYGGYLLFLTVVMFGYTIIDYGIHYTGTREVAKARVDGTFKDLYGYNQLIRWIFFILYSFCISFYGICFLEPDLALYVIFCGIPFLAGYTLTSSWFFQAVSDTKWLLWSSLLSRLINLVVILVFVRERSDLDLAIYSATYPTFISGLFLTYIAYKKYDIELIKFGRIKQYLVSSFDVFIGVLAPNFYNAIPVMVLGTISTPSEFAKFAVASRLCSIITVIQTVFSKAIFPVVSREEKSFVNYIMLANLLISVPIVLFLLFFGNEVIQLFLGGEYNSDINYLAILSLGMIFIGIANALSHGFFLPKGYDAIYRKISLNVSLLSGLISIVLIYQYGLLGGALSLTIARLLFSLCYVCEYRRIRKGPILV